MPFGRRRSSFGRDRGFYPPPSAPRPVKDGLQTKSKRGTIGETWWSQRFIEVLEDFHEGPRLVRGRAYARRGQVIDMDIKAGEVTARVQGSRARPYSVSIGVTVLDDSDWARVEEAMASQAVFLARLLTGEMPREIEDAFAATGLSLFPATVDDLDTECSCPDWENPCKHIAAVYYLLAEAFDRDPFLIFAWRGRPREQLLTELRALRALREQGSGMPVSGAIDEFDATLPEEPGGLFGSIGLHGADITGEITDEMASRFWEAGGDLVSVHVNPRTVAMPDAILRDLGPSGLSAGGRPLEDLLAPAYRAIAAAALRVAAGGEPEDGPPLDPNPLPPPKPRSSRARTPAPRRPKRGPSRDRLEQLIADATVDCYNESEERTGLFEMLAEHLEIPFVTTVLGVAVTVTAVELTASDEIVAVCRRGRDLLRIALLELPMPDPRPGGTEWVDAYRLWTRPG
ncbi:MAG: SWIM zinc finger family protein [Chloroflexota bacterium]